MKPARQPQAAAPNLLAAFNWPRAAGGFETFAEFPRQQAAVACEAACAVFRGFEAIRKVQEQAAHQAQVRHAAAAEKLRRPVKPAELFALQADLARFDMEAALRYWQSLAAAAVEMQTDVAGCCTHLVDAGKVLETAHSLEP
ncbi:phasin family protein [Ramlibacter albus]|uniref:Phasin family protein n=1 Tax=Ramlibacter albus TaxID=2079448 RepID=A0A923M4Z4_9BURK|nr:phasin family protein [Ramlibacter albus]MBC5763936.1 phasin family protein [Ramlibacter albus]